MFYEFDNATGELIQILQVEPQPRAGVSFIESEVDGDWDTAAALEFVANGTPIILTPPIETREITTSEFSERIVNRLGFDVFKSLHESTDSTIQAYLQYARDRGSINLDSDITTQGLNLMVSLGIISAEDINTLQAD